MLIVLCDNTWDREPAESYTNSKKYQSNYSAVDKKQAKQENRLTSKTWK